MKARMEEEKGFTLIEFIVVLAILALFILMAFFAWRTQLGKGRDGRRKADLDKMQNILEDYFNDHQHYPQPDEVSSGGIICRQNFSPYLSQPPCDPVNNGGFNYYYETDATGQWYKIYAKFENEEDPVIAELGCGTGCGPAANYDYGVSSPNVVGL